MSEAHHGHNQMPTSGRALNVVDTLVLVTTPGKSTSIITSEGAISPVTSQSIR